LTIALVLSLFTVAYVNLSGMMRALNPVLMKRPPIWVQPMGCFSHRHPADVDPRHRRFIPLLFVEAIADLHNPLVLRRLYRAGLAYLHAITGEYDVLAGAVLSIILLVPTLTVFMLHVIGSIGARSARSQASLPGRRIGDAAVGEMAALALTMFCAAHFCHLRHSRDRRVCSCWALTTA
jgi:hypothetical protein